MNRIYILAVELIHGAPIKDQIIMCYAHLKVISIISRLRLNCWCSLDHCLINNQFVTVFCSAVIIYNPSYNRKNNGKRAPIRPSGAQSVLSGVQTQFTNNCIGFVCVPERFWCNEWVSKQTSKKYNNQSWAHANQLLNLKTK